MIKKMILSALCLSMLSATAVQAADADVFINGQRLSNGGILYNNSVYVPLRAVGERMGADISWDDSTKSAHIYFSEDSLIPAIAEQVSPSVVAVVGNYKPAYSSQLQQNYNELTSHGTGVVIKSSGRILTNFHVVDGLENITVIFNDGSAYPAKVLYTDSLSDLAVIQINKLGLAPVTFAEPGTMTPGNTVIAIGTPISLSMRNTITRGIISASNVCLTDGYYPLIQTDAAINPGNSGGPLINMRGECVGINSLKYSGAGIEGLAFSIPTDTIKYVLDQFDKYGKVLRADLGITLENSWEAQLGLPTLRGITVKTSKNQLLLPGDTITAINGVPVHSIIDYNVALRDTLNGNIVNITYTRGDVLATIQVTAELK